MIDPRSCEIRISWTGGGPLTIRGRLAWLILKLAQKAPLSEEVNRHPKGRMAVDWNSDGEKGNVRAEVQANHSYDLST